MEATLCLRHGPSTRLVTVPSYNKLTTLTRHLGFRNSKPKLAFPGCIRATASPMLSHRSCIFGPFLAPEIQNDDGEGRHTQQVALGAVLLVSFVLGAMSLSPRVCPPALAEVQSIVLNVGGERAGRKIERSLSSRSVLMATVRSEMVAIERLLDSKRVNLSPSMLDAAEAEFCQLLKLQHPPIPQLQKLAARLEMSGKEDNAVALLIEAIKEREEAKREKGSLEEVYELQMILVEMLIYQGRYEQAKAQKCLLEGAGSELDIRRPLYLAVINTMLGEGKEAWKMWEKFLEVRQELEYKTKERLPPYAYSNFLDRVLLLKGEIEAARRSNNS